MCPSFYYSDKCWPEDCKKTNSKSCEPILIPKSCKCLVFFRSTPSDAGPFSQPANSRMRRQSVPRPQPPSPGSDHFSSLVILVPQSYRPIIVGRIIFTKSLDRFPFCCNAFLICTPVRSLFIHITHIPECFLNQCVVIKLYTQHDKKTYPISLSLLLDDGA